MPDFIVKRQTTKQDYDIIKKLLIKVRDQFLKEKFIKRNPEGKKLEDLTVTDEDLVELSFFDD